MKRSKFFTAYRVVNTILNLALIGCLFAVVTVNWQLLAIIAVIIAIFYLALRAAIFLLSWFFEKIGWLQSPKEEKKQKKK